MADELMRDLPGDLPTFLARFGTDAQCRAYLSHGRWPEGFCCAGCGHGRAYSHRVVDSWSKLAADLLKSFR